MQPQGTESKQSRERWSGEGKRKQREREESSPVIVTGGGSKESRGTNAGDSFYGQEVGNMNP